MWLKDIDEELDYKENLHCGDSSDIYVWESKGKWGTVALIWIDKGDILIVQDVSMRRDGKMFAPVIKF